METHSKEVDDIVNKNEEQLKNLIKKLNEFRDQIKEVFKEAGINPEEVASYFENPENFEPEVWEELQKQKEKFEEEFQRDLDNLVTPLEKVEGYAKMIKRAKWLRS